MGSQDTASDRNDRLDWMARLLFFLMLIVVKGVVVWRHEPWRDELAMIMPAVNEYSDLLRITQGLAFPLFHFIHLAVQQLSCGHAVFGAEIVASLISVLTAYVAIFRLRLPKRIAFPFLLTFYVMYEYTAFFRDYSLMVLSLLLLVRAEIGKCEAPRPHVYALLAFLALCHPLSLVLALGFLCYLLISRGFCLLREKAARAGLLLVAGCVLLSVYWLVPRYSGQLAPFMMPRPELIALRVATYLGTSFFGLCRNWNVYEYELLSALFVLPVLGGLAALLMPVLEDGAKRRRLMAVTAGWVVSVGGMLFIFLFRYSGQPRHVGLIYVVSLAYLWIGRHTLGLAPQRSSHRAVAWGLWALSCGLLIASSVFLMGKDFFRPFSSGRNVAHYLQVEKLDRRPVVIAPVYVTPPVKVYLPRTEFFYSDNPELNLWPRHTPYFDLVYLKMSNTERLEAIPDAVYARDPLVLVNEDLGPTLRVRQYLYRQTKAFRGAIVPDENYFLYMPGGPTSL